jgi:DNA topoisomerase III
VAELITKRYVGPLTGFRSRMGKPFAAAMKLNDEFRTEFDFGQGNASDNEPAPDFSKQERLGTCPKCGAGVFDHGVAYVCEKSVGAERSCDFRTGKIILQQPIEREQLLKLLSTGRTDLLPRFISKKGRPFKAFLVKTPGGKIGFEFQPRAAKLGTAARAGAPAAEVKPIRKEKPAPAAKAAKPPKRARPPARKRRAA